MGNYYPGSDSVELIIRDSYGGKIDVFKCTIKDFSRIMPILRGKYGFNFHPVKKKDKDLDWLKD